MVQQKKKPGYHSTKKEQIILREQLPLGQGWLWLTRRYIWAWDWLRGGEVVFPSSTDWVKVVALGELTL